MPKKIPIISRDYLRDVPLPTYTGGRYTVISHESIISFMEKCLEENNLFVEDRQFRAARGGDIAIGRYHIRYKDDPEIGLMISFINSYDKSTRFRCVVGGYNKIYGNSYVNGDNSLADWSRKHTGTADSEAEDHIRDQIAIASTFYDKILRNRALFKRINIIPQLKASILGYLYFEKELIMSEQAATIIDTLKSDLYRYKASTLWGLYNHITMAIKNTHPTEWLNAHYQVHEILLNTYALNLIDRDNSEEDLPGQLDLFDIENLDTFFNNSSSRMVMIDHNEIVLPEAKTIEEVKVEKVDLPGDDFDIDKEPQSFNLDNL